MDEWLVKVKHYGNGESVVDRTTDKVLALYLAALKNEQYQTDNYYVEKYDPKKVEGFGGPDPAALNKILDGMREKP